MQKKYSNDEIIDMIVRNLRRELSAEEEKRSGVGWKKSRSIRQNTGNVSKIIFI